jgi:hypothetical protein
MAQKETEQLNRMMLGAALSRAICSVADLSGRSTRGSPPAEISEARSRRCKF